MSEEKAESEKKVSFKVVDRRRFTDDGDARSGPDVAPARADPVRNDPPPPPAPPPPAAGAPVVDDTPPGALNFSMFIQSLAQQGLMQMGLIPWPHGQRELVLDAAKDTIDILDLLKRKTANNLTAEEQKLMDTIVSEMKLSFVEVQQAIARQQAQATLKRAGPPPGMR